MTLEERFARINNAEHIASFLDGIGESSGEIQTVKKAISILEEYAIYLKEENDWIFCSGKLPKETDGKVLICMPDGEVMTGKYSEYDERWYKGDMCGIGGTEPIAWMPLPEAPNVR